MPDLRKHGTHEVGCTRIDEQSSCQHKVALYDKVAKGRTCKDAGHGEEIWNGVDVFVQLYAALLLVGWSSWRCGFGFWLVQTLEEGLGR